MIGRPRSKKYKPDKREKSSVPPSPSTPVKRQKLELVLERQSSRADSELSEQMTEIASDDGLEMEDDADLLPVFPQQVRSSYCSGPKAAQIVGVVLDDRPSSPISRVRSLSHTANCSSCNSPSYREIAEPAPIGYSYRAGAAGASIPE